MLTVGTSDYGLIVCEKPDAARRIAEALADEGVESTSAHGVQILRCRHEDKEYVVCSALGHLYATSDSFRRRDVYPVFDIEWFPLDLVNRRSSRVRDRISIMRRLASGASYVINACDYDVEGETIGHNILKYACQLRDGIALRAKFSTLTKDELVSAISQAKADAGAGLARAGRVRHVLDFIWGINLSRVLTSSLSASGSGYRTVSIGRVQGPTLAFAVEREIAIRNFVPTPFWTITGVFEKDGARFQAPYATTLLKRADAELVSERCEGKTGTVSEVARSVFRESPPVPFNTGQLQREAYRSFGYSPTTTMRLVQRLYLDALVSYPRTNSQKLPPRIDYNKILLGLGALKDYSLFVDEVVKGELRPREGNLVDQAHPAIYPTGERPRKAMGSQELKLFDLIVRRFLSCFAEDAIRERSGARISVHGDEFSVTGLRTLRLGWLRYYSKYSDVENKKMPDIRESDELRVVGIDCQERFRSGPERFNQGTLLGKMESESIGTKATRADTISTLMERGYITDGSSGMVATELGLAVFEVMREFSPQIVSTSLTRETERELEEIETGAENGMKIIEGAVNLLCDQVVFLKSREVEIGMAMQESVVQVSSLRDVIGVCPVCKTGKLRVIKSAKTRKRFVGCTNYSEGCRASTPLPQRGGISAPGVACKTCGWPVIYVRFGRRRSWRLCVNVRCSSKRTVQSSAMQVV